MRRVAGPAATPAPVAPSAAPAQAAAPAKKHGLFGSLAHDIFEAFDNGKKLVQNLVAVPAEVAGDKAFDGDLVGAGAKAFPPSTPLDQVPAILPKNGKQPTETVLFVNGIGGDVGHQSREAQAIANACGVGVIGIHNATEGHVRDVLQTAKDELRLGDDKAADTLANVVYAQLAAGKPVHIIGHSQGGLIVSRALEQVEARLQHDDHLSHAQMLQRMSGVKVETFAAADHRFPDGPQYVHYVNKSDAVPGILGLGNPLKLFNHPGAGAVVRTFDTGSSDGAHNMGAYLSHWVPFDEAREGK